MSVLMAGIDHSQASLDIRSRFSFTKNNMEEIYAQILLQPDINGCVIISTCNRMEVWLSISDGCDWDAVDYLCRYTGADTAQYRGYFKQRRDMQAIEHLFRLTAGLESRILGEDQIITQVREAAAFARSVQASDSILEVLFRQAVTAAKRAKTEAFLSLADRSVIHTALDSLEKQGISVQNKKCMVIGNGMMGRLAAQTLIERGADVRVTVRKYHHKSVEIPEGCSRMDYADRYQAVPECDLIVSATTSPHYTLEYKELGKIKPGHTLYLLDLAVPRDIEPEISGLPDIFLYDIDSFSIDLQSDSLKDNLRKVETILNEEIESYLEWYEGRNCVRQIGEIKEAAGQDAMTWMIPYLKHIPLEPDEKARLKQEISGASGRMMNHLLFELRPRLKEDEFRDVMAAMQDILQC